MPPSGVVVPCSVIVPVTKNPVASDASNGVIDGLLRSAMSAPPLVFLPFQYCATSRESGSFGVK